ncbi:MAG: DinB family protein [Acidobacteriia bacterium]|nr:DinB family protein [Terriglobia bacterium]
MHTAMESITFRLVLMGMLSMTPLFGETLLQGERDRSMSHLHATRKQFLDAVAPLSDTQWAFKPSPERWSVAEVAEHLAATEDAVFSMIRKAMLEPPAPEKKASVAGKEDLILKAVPNRSRKVQAPEPVQPHGRWKTKAEAVAAFKQNRDRTIELVRTSEEDLRSHFAPHFILGLFDCYQWTVFLAAHADRHLQQMQEVVAGPGFPKK